MGWFFRCRISFRVHRVSPLVLFSFVLSECFEGTSFSRFCLSQNVRLLGAFNQGWLKSDNSIPDRRRSTPDCPFGGPIGAYWAKSWLAVALQAANPYLGAI